MVPGAVTAKIRHATNTSISLLSVHLPWIVDSGAMGWRDFAAQP